MKWIYPLFMWLKKAGAETRKAPGMAPATKTMVSFYSLITTLNNGAQFSFAQTKGRKVLIVNTASNCGYTNQYASLQQLYEQHKEKLVVIAFPSNDFKEQEKATDEEIAQFCLRNFGVSFPLVKKSTVLKGPGQNEVFKWLTNKDWNGWNEQPPSWNFSKYLVNEKGMLTHYFDPAVQPNDPEFLKAIEGNS